MEKNSVFVDSNYFVALFNENDTLYERARNIARQIEKEQRHLCISNLVFLEIVTVLSQRRGRTVGIEVGEYLRANPHITLVHADEFIHEKSWYIFQNTPQKNISFVDCGIIAVMKEENLKELLTFDQNDFKHLQSHCQFHFYSTE